MSEGASTGRLESLDMLRGGAALAVVASHAITYLEPPPTGPLWFRAIHHLLVLGHLGVPLFFVISGFCIHLRWAKQFAASGDTSLAFVPFWKRRLYRLYPPYFILLCVTMTMVVATHLRGISVPINEIYPEPRLRWMGFDFLAHATMLHGLSPIFDKAGGNPPYWTLAREEYFYLLYALLLPARRRWGLLRSVAGVLLLGLAFPVLMRGVLPALSPWWSVVNSSALVLWGQWCLGMVSVEAAVGLIKLPRWCTSWLMVPVWAVAALLCEAHPSLPSLPPLLWGFTFFTLLNACVVQERTGRWPHGGLVGWLTGVGLFSYSLYLVHNPVRMVLKRLLMPFAQTTNPLVYLLVTVILCVAGYLAARAYFWLVERHFLNAR